MKGLLKIPEGIQLKNRKRCNFCNGLNMTYIRSHRGIILEHLLFNIYQCNSCGGECTFTENFK